MVSIAAVATLVAVLATGGVAQAVTTPTTVVIKAPFRVSPQGAHDIAACVGEHVTFTDGQFNLVIHRSGDGSQFVFHRNVIGGLGVGDTTGLAYHATGHLQSVENLLPAGGETFTFELTLNVVRTDGGAHFIAHAVEHLTFSPDGSLTSDVEIFSISCT